MTYNYYKHTRAELDKMCEELKTMAETFNTHGEVLDDTVTEDMVAKLKAFPVRLGKALEEDKYRDPDEILDEIAEYIRYELTDNRLGDLYERFYGTEVYFDIDDAFGYASDLLDAICNGNYSASDYANAELFVDGGGWYIQPMDRDELIGYITDDLERFLDESEDVLSGIDQYLDDLSEEYWVSYKFFNGGGEDDAKSEDVSHSVIKVEEIMSESEAEKCES